MQYVRETKENVSAVDVKWWTGIVVKEEAWIGNEKTTKWAGEDSIPGYGQRYRVRIVGKHDRKELKDEELEVSNVIYPVTAGSGHANSSQTATLKQGTIVVGVTKDGTDGTEYWVLGVIGNQDQTKLAPKPSPDNGFENRSGYGDNSFRKSDGVDVTDIPSGGDNEGRPLESSTRNSDLRKRDADDKMEKDAKKSADLPTKRSCSGSEIQGIQLFLRNMIQDIQEAQQFLSGVSGAVNNAQSEVQKFIDQKIKEGSEFIGGKVKNIIEEIRKNTLELVNREIRKQYVNTWPTDRDKVKKIQDEVWEKASCVFNKFIAGLVNLVAGILQGLFDKIINVPLCLAQNLGSSILSQILGPLIALVNAALQPLFAILGIAADLGTNILNLVKNLLGFFNCEGNEECPPTTNWNFWNGPGTVSGGNALLDIDSVFQSAMSFAGAIGGAIDTFGNLPIPDFGGAVDSILSAGAGCLTDFINCGPPKVEFYGNAERDGGRRAAGNAIVSAAGDILGVDLRVGGFGYDNPPAVSIIDNCGTGDGARAIAVLNGGSVKGGGSNTVDYVVIETPGDRYLTRNNGTKGGDGRIWAKRNQTVVKRESKKWETPYNPGSPVDLLPGDVVTLPDGVIINDPITIPGGVPVTIEEPITIVTPIVPVDSQPVLPEEPTYDVLLTLCNPIILDTGVRYSPEDKIVIEPIDCGAELEPVFGPEGNLIDINVINPGTGFDFWPRIYVDSETGYNAKIVPNFCITRLADKEIEKLPEGARIVTVVDCVGKFIKN